jgi:hypothetical protein
MELMRGMALVIVLSTVGASAATALDISEATYANYQDYLKTIGSTKKGAFAVAADGYGSYFTYCYDVNCLSNTLTQEALTSCRSVTGKECLVMAYGRDERIDYTVVARRIELKDDDAILANVLDADRLKALIVGNTMQGEYPNHKKWMEHYAPDGTLRGKADQLGTFRGRSSSRTMRSATTIRVTATGTGAPTSASSATPSACSRTASWWALSPTPNGCRATRTTSDVRSNKDRTLPAIAELAALQSAAQWSDGSD